MALGLFARTCDYATLNTERISARVFLGLGGGIWALLTVGAAMVYPSSAGLGRFYPSLLVVVLAVVAFAVGLFFENLAAALLLVGAVATVVWGVLSGWELGVWGLMTLFLITPEVVSGLLFLMAAQMQKVCELEESA